MANEPSLQGAKTDSIGSSKYSFKLAMASCFAKALAPSGSASKSFAGVCKPKSVRVWKPFSFSAADKIDGSESV